MVYSLFRLCRLTDAGLVLFFLLNLCRFTDAEAFGEWVCKEKTKACEHPDPELKVVKIAVKLLVKLVVTLVVTLVVKVLKAGRQEKS
jgi:hypothetical protein